MAEEGMKRPGRNEACHCGSGQKYKHCCLTKDEEAGRAMRAQQASAAPPATPPDDEPAPHAAPPRWDTGQPRKRAAQSARGARRIDTPRKAG